MTSLSLSGCLSSLRDSSIIMLVPYLDDSCCFLFESYKAFWFYLSRLNLASRFFTKFQMILIRLMISSSKMRILSSIPSSSHFQAVFLIRLLRPVCMILLRSRFSSIVLCNLVVAQALALQLYPRTLLRRIWESISSEMGQLASSGSRVLVGNVLGPNFE